MKTLKQLKTKDIREAIKRGKGLSYLCEEFGSSEEVIVKQISLMYSKNQKEFESIIDDLKKVDRKTSRKTHNTNVLTPQEYTKKVIKEIKGGSVVNETSVTSKPLDTLKSTSNGDLASLKKQEEKLSKELTEIEVDYQRSINMHRGNLNSLRDLSAKLGKLGEELKRLMAEHERLVVETNKLSEETKAKYSVKKKKAKELKALREKITELEKVFVCVYQNGDISPLDDGPQLDDSGFELIHEEMLTKDEYQDLKVREIRTLARLAQIVKHLDKTYEVIFDDPTLELYFANLNL